LAIDVIWTHRYQLFKLPIIFTSEFYVQQIFTEKLYNQRKNPCFTEKVPFYVQGHLFRKTWDFCAEGGCWRKNQDPVIRAAQKADPWWLFQSVAITSIGQRSIESSSALWENRIQGDSRGISVMQSLHLIAISILVTYVLS
jgi:hypothetical protein